MAMDMKAIEKKVTKAILAFTIAFSSLGLMKIQNASAASIGGSWSKYANMDSRNKIVAAKAGVPSNAINIKSTYNVKTEGTKKPSAYQWTAWYNKHTKDFTIDKSQTSGTYKNGFPKRTSSTSTSTNFNKVGYFKYLRDPIYSNITMKATQTFTYQTKKRNEKWEFKDSKSDKFKSASATVVYSKVKSNIFQSLSKEWRLSKFTGKSDAEFRNWVLNNLSLTYYDHNGNRVSPNETYTYTEGNLNKTITTPNYKNQFSIKIRKPDWLNDDNDNNIAQGRVHYKVTITWKCQEKKIYYTTVNHGPKTVEIAKTKVASNVSATELAKFKPFSLQWKGGGTGAKNTTVAKKSNAGWWRRYSPPYHVGNRTTSDTSGGTHYYTFSTSGTYGTSKNIYNMIGEKERIFTQQAKPSPTQITDYKYKLTINPNGGEYLGSTQTKTYKGTMNSSTPVYRPYRKGYLFTGWKAVGEGSWDAANARFTFTGDSVLTAQWIKNNGPGPEGNNNKPTPPGGDKEPGTPVLPPNPGHDGDGYQPGVNPDGTRKEYTLTIDPNGGKYNYSTKVTRVTKQSGYYTYINPPTRNGYIFDGWKVVEGNAAYFSQGKYTRPSTYVFYGNARIQAQWLRDDSQTGTLVVDPNGGVYEGSTNKKTYTAKSGHSIPIRSPMRDGYQFIGWEIDTNNDVNGIFNTSANTFVFKRGKSTLKARWKKFNPDNCVIDGTGPNACPEMDRVIPKFIHLTKNPGEWDD